MTLKVDTVIVFLFDKNNNKLIMTTNNNRQQQIDRWIKFCREIDSRQNHLIGNMRQRTIAAMKALDPHLPATGEAFHLAHNWHKCREQLGEKSRKITWLMDSYHAKESHIIKLCDRLKSKSYNRFFEYQSANIFAIDSQRVVCTNALIA